MQSRVIKLARPDAPLPPRADTAHDLARWRDEREAADAELRSLTAQRAAMLLTATIDAITKKDAAIAAARVRVERAGVVVEAGERRIAELEAREAAREPERRRRYAAGQKAMAEAERLMRAEYGPAAAKLAGILSRLAELHATVGAANTDLPGDAEMLDLDAFRSLPATPSRYETRSKEVLVDVDGHVTKPPIRAYGGDNGTLDRGDGPTITVSGHGNGDGLRTEIREERVYIPASPAVAAPSLLEGVKLPGFSWNDAPLWPPASK